ncbi:hypothetical protein D3C87_1458710 [compost metagenome]
MGDVLAGGGAAGERHAAHQRMLGDGVADHRALAGQHADQAPGHAGFLADRGQFQRHQRRHFGRLDHHGVAGGERRRHLLRLAGNRRIPRRDGGHHAHRLVDAHGQAVAPLRRNGFLHGLAGGGEELERGGGAGDERARLADRLAVVQALALGQRLGAGADQLGHPVQHGGTLMRLALRPAAGQERAMGALHGFFHIDQAGRVQFGHDFAGGGVARGVAVARAQAPGAGDADR